MDSEGNLFFKERAKDLFKTANGKYIAPNVIENLLTSDAFIEQAVVIADGRSFVSALIYPSWSLVTCLLYTSSNECFMKVVREAVARDIVIVNVTQCPQGKVQMKRYETGRTLLSAGVLSGYDMTAEAAVAKLMYLLGLLEDSEQVKHYMGINLRGEFSPC